MTDLIKPMAEFSVEGPLKSISFDIGSYNVVISESIVVQWIVMLVLGIRVLHTRQKPQGEIDLTQTDGG